MSNMLFTNQHTPLRVATVVIPPSGLNPGDDHFRSHFRIAGRYLFTFDDLLREGGFKELVDDVMALTMKHAWREVDVRMWWVGRRYHVDFSSAPAYRYVSIVRLGTIVSHPQCFWGIDWDHGPRTYPNDGSRMYGKNYTEYWNRIDARHSLGEAIVSVACKRYHYLKNRRSVKRYDFERPEYHFE